MKPIVIAYGGICDLAKLRPGGSDDLRQPPMGDFAHIATGPRKKE
jgi:hypothetical protein